MNVDVLGRTLVRPAGQSKLAIADCDIHPRVRGYKDVYPWLAKRWQEHLEVFAVICDRDDASGDNSEEIVAV